MVNNFSLFILLDVWQSFLSLTQREVRECKLWKALGNRYWCALPQQIEKLKSFLFLKIGEILFSSLLGATDLYATEKQN